MKYQVTVTSVGDFSLQLLRTRESIIIFNKDVPYSYKNMVVSHTKSEVKEDIHVGDTLLIADFEYIVTAVGENAMETLRKNGHCTIVFNGADQVEQPGQIAVKGEYMPCIMVGDMIAFV